MRCATTALVILFVLVPSAPAGAVPPRDVRYAAAVDASRRAVRAFAEASGVPGLSIAVGASGRIVWSEGFGTADLERNVPVTPRTRFRLGSVSKVLTAAAVARLVDEGRLDLDTPVHSYVPSLPPESSAITSRMLAGHLGGIRHYGAKDFSNGRNIDFEHYDSVQDSLAIFASDPLVAPPGTKYHYTTFGYTLLSRVIERASGESFLECLSNRVFEPLGMLDTTGDRVRDIVANRTQFYTRGSDAKILHAPYVDSSYKWAGGGTLSTAEDLVRFGLAHLKPGFLKAETLDAMFTSQRTADGTETSVGIGWRIGTDAAGRRIAHHAGSIAGGRAVIVIYRDAGVVVAVLSNLSDTPPAVERTAMTIGEYFIEPGARRMAARAALAGDFDYTVDGVEADATGTITLRAVRGSLDGSMTVAKAIGGISGPARIVGHVAGQDRFRGVVAAPTGLYPIEFRVNGKGLDGRIAVGAIPGRTVSFKAVRRGVDARTPRR